MINRHGVQYKFEVIDENTYKLVGDFGNFWRYGGKDSGPINYDDLRFVDPSGGPFIGLGSLVEGREIIKISIRSHGILLQVKPIKGAKRVKRKQTEANPEQEII